MEEGKFPVGGEVFEGEDKDKDEDEDEDEDGDGDDNGKRTHRLS